MTSKPSIPSPEMRSENVVVKGRDSTFVITDGTYNDITISFGIRTYRGELNYQDTLNRLNEWLRVGWDISKNEIIFSEYPQWIFKVKSLEPYTWNHHVATGELTTEITLICDPYKYSETYNEVVGVTTTPVPMPMREYKFEKNSMYRARIEQNLQDITDLKKYGNTRVLDDDYFRSPSYGKSSLANVDGSHLFSHQTKLTSGSFKNFIDDFYSSTFTIAYDGNDISLAKVDVRNSRYMEVTFKNTTKTLFFKWKTVEPLVAGTDYYFDTKVNEIPPTAKLVVTDANGVIIASVDKQTSVVFRAKTTGVHNVEYSFNGYVPYLEFDSPRLHKYVPGKTEMSPARKSTSSGFIVAFDIRSMVDGMENTLLFDSMTEAQMKSALKTRDLKCNFNGWLAHATSSDVDLRMYNGATDVYDNIRNYSVQGENKSQTIDYLISSSFIDKLYSRVVNGRRELWAIFLVISGPNFDDNMADLKGKFFYTDKLSISLGMNVKPSSLKTIINTGTAFSFPFLKIWKQAGVNNCKVKFSSFDITGKNYAQEIEIINLASVTGNKHIEVDCDLKDVILFDEDVPSLSKPWNMNTITKKFPIMNVGTNIITVENADRVEIKWRTRRI